MPSDHGYIELRHLRYFLAAAEHGSFRKAGVHIGVRESGVSRHIRFLEEHLGVVLFQRNYGGVLLTSAGHQFIRQVRIAMKHICDGAREASTIGNVQDGCITVGMFSSLSSAFLSNLFQAYATRYKNIHADFVDGPTYGHISSVREKLIDVAFVPGDRQYEGCETTYLWSEQVFVALPMAHRLAQKSALTWSDFAREKFIVSEQTPGGEGHDIFVERLANLGRYADVRRQNVGRDNLMSLVTMGRGLTFVSEATTSTSFLGLVYRPIMGEMLRFSAVWESKNENPALHQLLRMALARRTSQSRSACL